MTRWLAALVAFVAAFAAVGAAAHAQPASLGHGEWLQLVGEHEPPVIHVLTFGPGESIYEKWGHAALCLAYPHAEPVCFNWGVTDFDAAADVMWGFLRGRQVFWMEPEPEGTMVGFYEIEDRDVYDQTLALPPDQARAIEQAVLAQLLGPDRFFIYDHFTDNCTTRIRDLVDRATGGRLRWGAGAEVPSTFRELGYRGLAGHLGLEALADVIVGGFIDTHPTVWQAMFLPDVLRDRIEHQLGATPRLVSARTGPPIPQDGAGVWSMLLFALATVVPLALARALGERAALVWLAVWLGGWGLVAWSLAAISPIPALRFGWSALVLVPFDVALPLLGPARRRRYVAWRALELNALLGLRLVGVLHCPVAPLLAAITAFAIVRLSARSAPPAPPAAAR